MINVFIKLGLKAAQKYLKFASSKAIYTEAGKKTLQQTSRMLQASPSTLRMMAKDRIATKKLIEKLNVRYNKNIPIDPYKGKWGYDNEIFRLNRYRTKDYPRLTKKKNIGEKFGKAK